MHLTFRLHVHYNYITFALHLHYIYLAEEVRGWRHVSQQLGRTEGKASHRMLPRRAVRQLQLPDAWAGEVRDLIQQSRDEAQRDVVDVEFDVDSTPPPSPTRRIRSIARTASRACRAPGSRGMRRSRPSSPIKFLIT